jgi:hypothetical protein
MVAPAVKQRKEKRLRLAWAIWPRRLVEGDHVGCRIWMARVRARTPRELRRGCGETRGRRGCRKTESQMLRARRTAPTREIQPVPGRGVSKGIERRLKKHTEPEVADDRGIFFLGDVAAFPKERFVLPRLVRVVCWSTSC